MLILTHSNSVQAFSEERVRYECELESILEI